jgi:diguanylate cyclase (GGDEF)-like protein
MPYAIVFSLIYYIAFTVYFFLGFYILSLNRHSVLHQVWFYICFTLCIWAFSFSISNSAATSEISIYWRRVGAIGWGAFYSLLLHFILILTGKIELLKKWWIYLLLYSPIVINIFVFSIYSHIAIQQYSLIQISTGWVNIIPPSIWDRFYQVYYLSFSMIGIGLIWQWGTTSKNRTNKTQAYLLVGSIFIAILLGTFTEYIINIHFSLKVPQLGPVVILIPISVMFYCIKKYGLMAPKAETISADSGQILNNITRLSLYQYITIAFILGGFVNFAAQYFNHQEPLGSAMLFSTMMVLIGFALQLIQTLKIKTDYKDIFSGVILAISVPVMILRYIDYAGFYALGVPIIFVMVSVAFNQRWLLSLVGASTVLTLLWVWIKVPTATITTDNIDHISRIIIFGIFLAIAYNINRIYLKRLAEEGEQVRLQKLLSLISANFAVTDENNIDLKITEVLNLLGEHFKVDRILLFFFSSNESIKNHCYQWHNIGIESIIDIVAETTIADLPDWVNLQKLTHNSGIDIPDVASLPQERVDKEWLQQRQIKSILVLPLINREKVIGFFILESIKNINIFSQSEQEILKVIANNITDIWVKVEVENKINYMAFHDALTGLPNRILIEDRMDQAIHLAIRTGKNIAVLFIDLDNLKAINDSLGHDNGDNLLKQVANRLSGSLRQYDTVGRFGGDEFLVMNPQISQPEDAIIVANKIMGVFHEPMIINNQEFYITASMGIAIFPLDGETTQELIKNADMSMYISKEKGKNGFTLCSSDMKNEFRIKAELTNSLYRALERKELVLYYQPKISITTGKIVGVEALIRWNHPQNGLILPNEFIPLAEKNGLIISIGQWVLQTACHQNKAWQDQGLPPIRMAVNLSLGQFLSKNLVRTVATILQETSLNPAYLELEITESIAIKEPEYIIQTLNELKELGVSISIDDFGTEYSSLSRLKSLPIDNVKIDKQFIHGLSNGFKEEGIVKVILDLGRTLGLTVTAEGVETEQQLAFLREVKCDEIQGFYFYKPMPNDAIEVILKDMPTCLING